MIPVSKNLKSNRAATSLPVVVLPEPAGPSIAMRVFASYAPLNTAHP
jgi:predicted dienelactone hydrolase